jgi:hypothetical protein
MGFAVNNEPTNFKSISPQPVVGAPNGKMPAGQLPEAWAPPGPGGDEKSARTSPSGITDARTPSQAEPDPAAELVHVAKEAIQSTVKAVAAQASELTANVVDELSATATTQKDRGADVMRGFAKAMVTAAEELRTQSPQVARGVRGVARNVESLADNLRTQSIPDLFRGASEFARKQPASFFAGAVVAGFALSRFLKSHKPSAVPTSSVGSEAGAGSATSSMGE